MSSKSIRLDIDDSIRDDLLVIKKFLGIRSNADIVRWLITEKAREIRQGKNTGEKGLTTDKDA